MDEIDKKLINAVQEDFPLAQRPFAELAERVGLKEKETIERLKRLKKRGVIRRVGAIFSPENLEMVATLVAMHIPEAEQIEKLAKIINEFEEVTHNYWREHFYNLWFTIAAPDNESLQKIIGAIKRKTGIKEILQFPAKRRFKIDARFSVV